MVDRSFALYEYLIYLAWLKNIPFIPNHRLRFLYEGSILFPANLAPLNELLEGTVYRRTRFGPFVEVNGS